MNMAWERTPLTGRCFDRSQEYAAGVGERSTTLSKRRPRPCSAATMGAAGIGTESQG